MNNNFASKSHDTRRRASSFGTLPENDAGVDDLEEPMPTGPPTCKWVANPQTLAVIKYADMSLELLAFLHAHHRKPEGVVFESFIFVPPTYVHFLQHIVAVRAIIY